MDDRRFDQVTKMLATGLTRRRLAKLAGALALGTVLPFGKRAHVLAAPCLADAECGDGVCCSTGFCAPSADLCFCSDDAECPGAVCCTGLCMPWSCCPGDGPGSHCASGTICADFGECVEGCLADDHCPGSVCCFGSCGFAGQTCCTGLDDGRCAVNETCFEGTCSAIYCAGDGDCPGSSICCFDQCTPEGIECCSEPSDTHCPPGESCFEGQCDPIGNCVQDLDCASGNVCVGGTCVPSSASCCDAITSGGSCAPNACCTQTDAPNDYCPAGSSCVASGSPPDGVCCVPEDQPCLNGTPCCGGYSCVEGYCRGDSQQETPESAPPTVDKWALWSGAGARLGGATAYVRRVTRDDDPEVWGTGAVGPNYRQRDFERLARLGANYVDISHPAPLGATAPYALADELFDNIDRLVRAAEKADLFAVISLRTGPGRDEAVTGTFPVCQAGGCYSGGAAALSGFQPAAGLWDDEFALDAWVSAWSDLARRFKNKRTVIGYHVIAMPDAPDNSTYLAFVERIVNAIRAEDAVTPILLSPLGSGRPVDLAKLETLDDVYAVYRFDVFLPSRYVRQDPADPGALAYGDPFDPEQDAEEGDFDARWVERMLQPALDWSAENRKPVVVGAYGAPRWQPGFAAYLADLHAAFERGGLNSGYWMWHAGDGPAGDDAFNPEHGTDPGRHENDANPLTGALSAHWKGLSARASTGA